LLNDTVGVNLRGHVSLDGGITQQAVVKGLLGLVGLAAGGVHNQGDAIVEEQVKVLQGSMLDAQGLQSGSIDLRCEVFEQQPGGLVDRVIVGTGSVLSG
jgi:hypothetical protein